jgi:uncharacterized membrane protein HdeD (DUF308 family)
MPLVDPAFDPDDLRRHSGRYLLIGLLLVLCGLLALGYSTAATLASVLVLGWVLSAAGVLHLIHTFQRWRVDGPAHLLFGPLSLLTGILIVARPASGAVTLTLLLGAFLVVAGIFRGAAALSARGARRGLGLFHGLLTALLGVIVLAQWPLSGLWVIGLFVGIDLLLAGASVIAMGLGARSYAPRRTAGV